MYKPFLVFSLLILLTACAVIAVNTTPKKSAIASQSPLANQAEQAFWETLHQGNYHQIPTVEKLLLAAYLENPHDPKLAAHLGFLETWKIAERHRETGQDPTIVNSIILANKYFADAIELDPHDARFLGFYGVTFLVEGQIFQDQRQQAHGYFILKDAIRKWPQFNYFTAGYPMSSLDSHSKQFQEGLAWEWRNLDVCAKEKVNRQNPNFKKYMSLQTTTGKERACWNSWIAPYNFEGFFLNMGDMLVKSGDWTTAIKIYQNAKLANNYSYWPYRSVLEERIKDAKLNTILFNDPEKYKNKMIMFNSNFSCMACHRAT